MIPILTVNGISMENKLQPAKNGYNLTKSDLYADSSGRSAETGTMLPYLIRKDVHSIELTYVGTAAQIAEIEGIFAGTLRQYTVTFLDNDQYISAVMYPSDRTKSTEVIIQGVPYMQMTVSLVEL